MHDPHGPGLKVEVKVYKASRACCIGYWRSNHHHYLAFLTVVARVRVK